jgi:hypothetical protein
VLVAQHLQKLGSDMVTLLAHLNVDNLERRSSLDAGSTWEKKGGEQRGGAEKRKILRVEVWHGKHKMPVARVCVLRTGESSGFTTSASRAFCAVRSALGVGGCCPKTSKLGRCTVGRLYP